ncbi:unnamed protein product [Mytilus coruscus]|uniref:Uncharacterized protein n=1 Tax=Mytilus coruscus TaxID=42192 RepID=A0A6J7ZYZ3_MYTCO|nr:unnamed protein product [Mytilus coruscus]
MQEEKVSCQTRSYELYKQSASRAFYNPALLFSPDEKLFTRDQMIAILSQFGHRQVADRWQRADFTMNQPLLNLPAAGPAVQSPITPPSPGVTYASIVSSPIASVSSSTVSVSCDTDSTSRVPVVFAKASSSGSVVSVSPVVSVTHASAVPPALRSGTVIPTRSSPMQGCSSFSRQAAGRKHKRESSNSHFDSLDISPHSRAEPRPKRNMIKAPIEKKG